MTNADKIRAMTDEELLYLLMRVADGNTPTSISLHRDYDDGYKKWIWSDWLKQEVAENV